MLIAIIVGALIGASFMGFSGGLLGAVAGFWVFQMVAMGTRRGKLGAIQNQFLSSTFAVMGALCKADGQVTAADIISHARCEFAVFAGGRKYAMRADTKFELDMWLEVCNRHGRMWLTDLSV